MYITINTGLHFAYYERVWYDAETGVLRFYWNYILIPKDEWTWNVLIAHHLVTKEEVTHRKALEVKTVEKHKFERLQFERRIAQAEYEFERSEDIRSLHDKIYVSYEVKIPHNLSPKEVVNVFCKIARRGFLVENDV